MWIPIALALFGLNLAYGDNGQEAAERQQRILAAYSTRTLFSMTTTTVTSFYTCASAFAAVPNACVAGRKMRRYTALKDEDLQGDRSERDLASSLSEDIYDSDLNGRSIDDRGPRIALTVWSTSTTPYTWTSTSVNSATTFSLSYWCSIVGQEYPPACG